MVEPEISDSHANLQGLDLLEKKKNKKKLLLNIGMLVGFVLLAAEACFGFVPPYFGAQLVFVVFAVVGLAFAVCAFSRKIDRKLNLRWMGGQVPLSRASHLSVGLFWFYWGLRYYPFEKHADAMAIRFDWIWHPVLLAAITFMYDYFAYKKIMKIEKNQ